MTTVKADRSSPGPAVETPAGPEGVPPPSPTRGGRRAWRGHAAGLDGMRAVAVAAVLAFHGGLSWASGGMLGVDVFFVLSGFLITSLLMAEFEDRGTIRLGAFWARRARRLLPALFVLLLGVALYALVATGGNGVSTIRGDGLATLLYVANWHAIVAGQSYFVQYGPPSPLLHTWSLAIEEQFYLVWPIVALFVLRRFGARGLVRVAAGGAAVSALLMAVLFEAGYSVDRLYYGTDTRAQAIMVGAFLGALGTAHRRHRRGARAAGAAPPSAGRSSRHRAPLGDGRWAPLASWRRASSGSRLALSLSGLAGAGFVAWAFTALSGEQPILYEGGFLLVSVATALVLATVIRQPRGGLARALSLRPLVGLGKISYGVYLFHWPLFLYLDTERTGLSGAALFLVRCGATLVVATASYFLVEQPIRRRRFLSATTALVAVPAAVAVTVLALVASTVTSSAGDVATTKGHARYAALVAAGQAQLRPWRPLVARHPVRVMIFGDSVGVTLYNGLHQNERRWGIWVDPVPTATLGCDLDPNLLTDLANRVARASQGCVDWRAKWAKEVREQDPDVAMVLLGRWEIADHLFEGRWVHPGDPAWDRHLVTELDQAVGIMSSRGAHVMLLTFPYVNPVIEGPNNLSLSINPVARVDAFNRVLAEVARRHPHQVTLVNTNRYLDPAGHYTSTVDGLTVRWSDREHLSLAGGEFLQPLLLPEAVRLGAAHDQVRTTVPRG